jgi:predicted amidohydrolase YtcJ
MRKFFAVVTVALAIGCATQKPMSTNTLSYINGTIWGHSSANSVVVESGKIIFVGDAAEAGRAYPSAKTVDLKGATVLPGLVDAHGHIYGLGQSLDTVRLNGSSSVDEVVDRVVKFDSTLPAGEWLLGRGWDQNDWPVKEFPIAGSIDAKVSNRPVWLRRIDGHAALANSAAMRAAGITAATPDPSGGRIVRDAAGNPTGVFVDNAMELVEKVIPEPSKERRRREIETALRNIAANGLTAVHDAGAEPATIDILRELADEGKLPVRVYVMVSDDAEQLAKWFASGPLQHAGGRLNVRSIKLYADGALGSRGAAMLAPYNDDPKNSGLLLTNAEHIRDVAERAKKSGFQVCTHAIGDRGARMVLESYEAAGVTKEDRFRIEHLQVVALEDLPRLAARGIIASMQPTHATSDMDWAERRVGAERIRGAYAWRSVLRNGIPLAFGSDFPIEEVNPFYGIYAAVTRQDRDGSPAGGWYPEERVTLEEAIDGFTRGAAYASFEEQHRGTIGVGRDADFTVVKELATPLWKTEVLYTIVGGETVYRK